MHTPTSRHPGLGCSALRVSSGYPYGARAGQQPCQPCAHSVQQSACVPTGLPCCSAPCLCCAACTALLPVAALPRVAALPPVAALPRLCLAACCRLATSLPCRLLPPPYIQPLGLSVVLQLRRQQRHPVLRAHTAKLRAGSGSHLAGGPVCAHLCQRAGPGLQRQVQALRQRVPWHALGGCC
jgi:hypothetical protein